MNKKFNKILIWPLFGLVILTGMYIWDAFLSSYEKDVIIPIDYINIPKGLMMTGQRPLNLEVTLDGSKSDVRKLSDQSLSYVLSLDSASHGMNSISFTPENIKLPGGIVVTKINPQGISLRLEKEVRVDLPFRVVVSGKAAPGYMVADTLVTPQTLSIRGPESLIENTGYINTKPVDIAGASETFRKEVVPDIAEEIEITTPNKGYVAEIRIIEKVVEKQFLDIPVVGKDALWPYEVMPNKVDLEIRGPENLVDKFDPVKDVSVTLDLKDLAPGVYVRRANITLPLDMLLVSVNPEIFTVTLVAPK
ncbi:MAG: hypothetical protein KJ737_19380 [Proteobacteria bacterium]|nr:hypothetical protein [Pseudomonadota bacterium]